MSNPETYTIAEIDAAISAIAGCRGLQANHRRPRAMLDAAAVAWTDERPEDEHSRVLRAAIRDLNTKGHLAPSDGVWPGEA